MYVGLELREETEVLGIVVSAVYLTSLLLQWNRESRPEEEHSALQYNGKFDNPETATVTFNPHFTSQKGWDVFMSLQKRRKNTLLTDGGCQKTQEKSKNKKEKRKNRH